MKSLVLTFFIAVSAITLHAQTVNFDWVAAVGGTALDRATAIAIDDANNIYATGYFRFSADFDPSVSNMTMLDATGFAAFVCKFSPAGNLIWARAFQAAGQSYGQGIAIDQNDNVLVTGYFTGTIDLDPGIDSLNITSAGFNDAFISKLDSAGNLVWGKSLSGTLVQNGYAIAADMNGNIYTVGNFTGTADFNPDTAAAATYNLTATSASDIYISKLNTNGNFVWAKRIGVGGSTGLTYAFSKFYGIALDTAGRAYLTGHFAGETDFGTDTLTAVNDWDIFICKLNPNGSYAWVKQMGSTGTDIGIGIAVDNTGNLYACGGFSNTVDFDLGSGVHYMTATGGNEDVYMAKYTTAGNFVWSQQIGSSGVDVGFGITTDNNGGVYTIGLFSGTIDFDPGTGVNMIGSTGDDIFIERLDNTGTFSLAYVFGSPTANIDEGLSVAVDNGFNIYSAGHYSGSIDFNPDTANASSSTSVGNEDIFIHKMTQCLATYHTVAPTACFHYSSNGQNYSATGTYTQMFTNAAGCDSFLIINLAINTVDVTVQQTGSILSSNATGATYQWLDCNNAMSPLIGETGYQLYPTLNGHYAVDVTVNGCSDTSTCTEVTNVGIDENSFTNQFEFYPDPANDFTQLNCRFLSSVQLVQFEIISVTGVLIRKINLNVNVQKQLLDVSELPPGIYFCRLIVDNSNVLQKKLVVAK